MKPKTDFEPFKVGSVFNQVKGGPYTWIPRYESVTISYPSRLDVMAIDPSKISANDNLVFTPGEVVLKVKIFKTVTVRLKKDSDKIIISPLSKRHSLIKHSALLMKKALNFKNGLEIEVDNSNELRHVGLGSSSGLIACVACAINEIFDNPISPANLVQYLAHNHGEEIDNSSDYINPVQCIGGSASSGLYSGALLILAGQSRVIQSMKLDENYHIIIGIPKDFVELDSKMLLEKELQVMDKFINCGKKYGPHIAYQMLHKVLPAMTEGNFKTVGNFVYDYRFNMGSIENCSYTYPGLVTLANNLSSLKHEGVAEMISISSVGPAIFVVTKNLKKCKKAFEKQNLNIYLTRPCNRKYKVLKRKAL